MCVCVCVCVCVMCSEKYYGSQWLASTVWLQHSLKYIILGSTAKRNSYRFGTTNLYEFHFWVNCPFKEDKLNTDIEQKWQNYAT